MRVCKNALPPSLPVTLGFTPFVLSYIKSRHSRLKVGQVKLRLHCELGGRGLSLCSFSELDGMPLGRGRRGAKPLRPKKDEQDRGGGGRRDDVPPGDVRLPPFSF